MLLSLAPLDYIAFSSVVDLIIRGELADQDQDEAKRLFNVPCLHHVWPEVVMNRPEDTALAKHDIVVEGGFLTLTAGSAAWKPGKGAVIAGALNTGVINMTQGLGAAPRDKRIRVNTVVTGSVITEHRDSVFDKLGLNKEEQDAWFEKTVAEPHP